MLIYGAETWTISETVKKLEATEMCCYRRMLEVTLTDIRINTDVLQVMETEPRLMAIIKKRQMTFFGGHRAHDEKRGTGELGSYRHGGREKGKDRQENIDINS